MNGWLDLSLLLLAASAASSSEEIEDISKTASLSSAFLETILSIPIVGFSLLRISKYFVSYSNILKLLRISSLIRMLFESNLSEALLDLILSGILLNLQEFVVSRVIHFLGGTSSS